MGSSALGSHGTIVARQDGGSGNFTDVGELLDISTPARSREAIDVTAQADDLDVYVAGGIERREPLTFSIQVDPDGTSYSGLEASFQSKQTDGWRVTFPDSSTLIFSGFVMNMGGVQAGVDDKLTEDITVRPSGAYTDTNA